MITHLQAISGKRLQATCEVCQEGRAITLGPSALNSELLSWCKRCLQEGAEPKRTVAAILADEDHEKWILDGVKVFVHTRSSYLTVREWRDQGRPQ